jgi:hypothetical protein
MQKMSQNVWATIMPFGPVTLIFHWPKFIFFRHCPLLSSEGLLKVILVGTGVQLKLRKHPNAYIAIK